MVAGAVDQTALPLSRIRSLFLLLSQLHQLFKQQPQLSPAFSLYWEAGTNLIAFNADGQLWYNAAKDCAFDNPSGRIDFWYLVICHELAHNIVHAHNSDFSQAMSEIVLTFSQDLRQFQDRFAGQHRV